MLKLIICCVIERAGTSLATFLVYGNVTDLSIYAFTVLVDLGHFFSFLNLHTVGKTPWTGEQHVARPLPTQTQNKHTETPKP
jgi:hypothetical protein